MDISHSRFVRVVVWFYDCLLVDLPRSPRGDRRCQWSNLEGREYMQLIDLYSLMAELQQDEQRRCIFYGTYICIFYGAYICIFYGAYICIFYGAYICIFYGAYICIFYGAYISHDGGVTRKSLRIVTVSLRADSTGDQWIPLIKGQ